MHKSKLILQKIIFSFKRNYEFWIYTKSISFLFKIIFLEIIIMIRFLSKRFDGFYQKMFSLIKGDVIFNTPFGKFLASNPNGYFVMEENYEPKVKKIIKNNIHKFSKEKENIFLNIGSHIGRRSIDISKNYNYKSLAFEPSPQTYNNLKINILLSNVEAKVIPLNFGLGDKEGDLDFEYIPGHDGSSRVFQEGQKSFNHSRIIKVPIKRLDDLSLGIDNEHIRLIMIDVEGFEYNVLRGMSNILDSLKNIDIIVEILPENNLKSEIIKYMEDKGYQAKEIDDIDYHFWR